MHTCIHALSRANAMKCSLPSTSLCCRNWKETLGKQQADSWNTEKLGCFTLSETRPKGAHAALAKRRRLWQHRKQQLHWPSAYAKRAIGFRRENGARRERYGPSSLFHSSAQRARPCKTDNRTMPTITKASARGTRYATIARVCHLRASRGQSPSPLIGMSIGALSLFPRPTLVRKAAKSSSALLRFAHAQCHWTITPHNRDNDQSILDFNRAFPCYTHQLDPCYITMINHNTLHTTHCHNKYVWCLHSKVCSSDGQVCASTQRTS